MNDFKLTLLVFIQVSEGIWVFVNLGLKVLQTHVLGFYQIDRGANCVFDVKLTIAKSTDLAPCSLGKRLLTDRQTNVAGLILTEKESWLGRTSFTICISTKLAVTHLLSVFKFWLTCVAIRQLIALCVYFSCEENGIIVLVLVLDFVYKEGSALLE